MKTVKHLYCIICCLWLAACGLAPQNPYPQAKLLTTKVIVTDSQDVRKIANRMVNELSRFEPVKAMAKDKHILVQLDPIKNTTLYQFNDEKFAESMEAALQAHNQFKVTHHSNTPYHISTKMELIKEQLVFSIKLENADTGLIIWQDQIDLKVSRG